MSEPDSDAARFFKRAEAFFCALARKRNLGLAIGRWDHPRFGAMRILAVYGQFGRLYVTLVFCGTESWLKHEQARLWWYLSDQAEPFEFKHVATRRPMSASNVKGALAMGKAVLKELKWLEARESIDAVIADQFERNLGPLAKLGATIDDPDNELPTGGPDEEKPE